MLNHHHALPRSVKAQGAKDDAMSVSPQWDAPVRVVLEMRALTELHLPGSQRDRCDILSCFLTTTYQSHSITDQVGSLVPCEEHELED